MMCYASKEQIMFRNPKKFGMGISGSRTPFQCHSTRLCDHKHIYHVDRSWKEVQCSQELQESWEQASWLASQTRYPSYVTKVALILPWDEGMHGMTT